MIWFEASLSQSNRDLGALEVLSIHLFIHRRYYWHPFIVELHHDPDRHRGQAVLFKTQYYTCIQDPKKKLLVL